MRGERVAPWADEPGRSVPRAPHEFPRALRYPPRRADAVEGSARPLRRTLSDDPGNGALPQAECAWARSVWLPRVMRTPWMCWAQAVRDTLIGQIP